jgi:CheY-like chemotaxis protein
MVQPAPQLLPRRMACVATGPVPVKETIMMQRSLRILVAEDHPLVLVTIANQLEEAGFLPEGAVDGEDAIERLSDGERPIDLLITDINMGEGFDGWAVAERGRLFDPHLKVIYMTGDPGADNMQRRVPGSLLLLKPVRRNDLLTAIDLLGIELAEPVARAA